MTTFSSKHVKDVKSLSSEELLQLLEIARVLRMAMERNDQEKLKELHPYHEDFIKILEKYPLRLELNKVKNIEGSLDSIWEFQIFIN